MMIFYKIWTKCANFLEENDDYVSAHGNAALFKLEDQSLVKGKVSFISDYWKGEEYDN